MSLCKCVLERFKTHVVGLGILLTRGFTVYHEEE